MVCLFHKLKQWGYVVSFYDYSKYVMFNWIPYVYKYKLLRTLSSGSKLKMNKYKREFALYKKVKSVYLKAMYTIITFSYKHL